MDLCPCYLRPAPSMIYVATIVLVATFCSDHTNHGPVSMVSEASLSMIYVATGLLSVVTTQIMDLCSYYPRLDPVHAICSNCLLLWARKSWICVHSIWGQPLPMLYVATIVPPSLMTTQIMDLCPWCLRPAHVHDILGNHRTCQNILYWPHKSWTCVHSHHRIYRSIL